MSRPLTVAVLSNPTARRGRRAAASADVVRALEDAGHRVLDIRSTSGAEAGRAARRLVHEHPGGDRPDALVVVGGDGMVRLGVGAVAGTATPLGIVPTGTGNDAARHLGIPHRDPEAVTRQLLGELTLLVGGAVPDAVDAVRMTRPTGSRFADVPAVPAEDAWALAVVSAGLDAAVNVRANATAWPRGEARYLRPAAGAARRCPWPTASRWPTFPCTWRPCRGPCGCWRPRARAADGALAGLPTGRAAPGRSSPRARRRLPTAGPLRLRARLR